MTRAAELDDARRRTTTSPDVALFVEQATWLAKRLSNPTRFGLLAWICARLHDGVRRRWLALFPLLHKDQEAAEEALCVVLSVQLLKAARVARTVEVVDRRVDWAETFARSTDLTRPPLTFRTSRDQAAPDRRTIAALLTLAQGWSRLLQLAATVAEVGPQRDGLLRRRSALEGAMDGHQRRHVQAVAYDSVVTSRLRRGAASEIRLAAALDRVSRLWSVWFSPETDEDQNVLRVLAATLRDADALNTDTLLEFTTAISIVRACVEADQADWPTPEPWRLVSIDDVDSSSPRIQLRSGALSCEVTKGRLRLPGDGHRRPDPLPDATSRWLDAVLPAKGRSRSTGNQPDIVLAFWLGGRRDFVEFALADAKRNVTGDGESYLRQAVDVAASYLLSYGHALGLEVPAEPGTPIATRLTPGVTIFARQGTRHTEAAAVELLRAAPPLPTVFALDVEQHFGLGRVPWRAPTISAWMGALGRQAAGSLNYRHGAEHK